jgi:hypothetical protein
MSQYAFPITIMIGERPKVSFFAVPVCKGNRVGVSTKNCCANLAPLRLCWYFTDNDTGLVTSYIVQRNM